MALQSTVEGCVMSNCTIPEALVTKNATQTICGVAPRAVTVDYLEVSVVLMAFTTVFVWSRLIFKRFYTTNGLRADDWLILATWLTCIPSAVINHVYLMNNGLGRDIWTLTPDTLRHFAIGFWAMELLYFFETFALKLSMIGFYLTIFPGRPVRRLLLLTGLFDILFGVAFIFVPFGQCVPLTHFWTQFEGSQGRCIDFDALAWAHGAISIAIDVWLITIPIYQLRHLQLSPWKKAGVSAMFFVGSFVTVISIVRLVFLVQMQGSINLTWDYFPVCLWSTVEVTVGVMCTCMPTLRLILVGVTRRVSTTIREKSSSWSLSYATREKSAKHDESCATQDSLTRTSTAVAPKQDCDFELGTAGRGSEKDFSFGGNWI
ncbi:CFEM domain-containing protein [Pestalotiopsis sp. NC0098]|nr:CFEM domain-containing protein [Pestalotiopsis sp. NC0098]